MERQTLPAAQQEPGSDKISADAPATADVAALALVADDDATPHGKPCTQGHAFSHAGCVGYRY